MQLIPFAFAHPGAASIQEGFKNAINSVSEGLKKKWENEYMQKLNAHYMRQGIVLEKILSENGELPSNIVPTKQGLEYALIWHGIKKGLRDEAYQKQMREIEKAKAMMDDKIAAYRQAIQLSPTKDPEAIISLAYGLYKKRKEEGEDKNLTRALQKYALMTEIREKIQLPYEKEKIKYREELKSKSKPEKTFYVEYKGKFFPIRGEKALENALKKGAKLTTKEVYNKYKTSKIEEEKPIFLNKPVTQMTDKELQKTFQIAKNILSPLIRSHNPPMLTIENLQDLTKRKTLFDIIEEIPNPKQRRLAKFYAERLIKAATQIAERQGYRPTFD